MHFPMEQLLRFILVEGINDLEQPILLNAVSCYSIQWAD